jgi:hypothetical protein
MDSGKDLIVFNVAAIAIFGLIGLTSLFGVVWKGAWWQLTVFGMCAAVIAGCCTELRNVLRRRNGKGRRR